MVKKKGYYKKNDHKFFSLKNNQNEVENKYLIIQVIKN